MPARRRLPDPGGLEDNNGLVRSRTSPRVRLGLLDRGHLDRLGALGPLLNVELDTLIFLERAKTAALNLGVVDENIRRITIRGDKAETLVAVEPFHSSLCHLTCFSHFSIG